MTRIFESIERRVRLLVRRGISQLFSAAGKVLTVQVRTDGGAPIDDVEVLEHYGHWSHPLVGAETPVVALNGNRSHCVVISCPDRRYRPRDLAAGEVAVGAAALSCMIYFRAGKLHVKPAPGTPIHLDGDVIIEKTLQVKGAATFDGAMIHGGKHVDSSHQHASGGTPVWGPAA